MNNRRYLDHVLFVSMIIISLHTGTSIAQETEEVTAERGHYLVRIAGCNDCHTAGYLLSEGNLPEVSWLLGDTFGWRGPWGTTYAKNLRITLRALTEDQWLVFARNLKTLPPMPWFTLNQMKENDLRSIYKYVRTLDPVGEPAPLALPPGEEPGTAYALFPSPPEE